MIRKVVIRNFKRFKEITFDVPDHVVIAGPNNTGKTTVLQAIAAWNLALRQWKTLNDPHKHKGAFAYKPISRQTFSAVPLNNFELLWNERNYDGSIEIEIQTSGWTLSMELIADSTEQIYVRPIAATDPQTAQNANLDAAYVPPMSGLSIEEPVYQKPYLEQRLGQARPGEVLRNLLLEAHGSELAWGKLQLAIFDLFGFVLRPPNSLGPFIVAEYSTDAPVDYAPRFDIASAGSGFQQVLMLLTFLTTRPASVLLLDEPDAHLHVILQDAIFNKLRGLATEQKSQLIIATHSEIIINSVEPKYLCVLLDQPRMITDEQQKKIAADSVRILSNTDIMLAQDSPGVLYVEGNTDLNILQEWARILNHPLYTHFESRKLFWKPKVSDQRIKGTGIKSTDHYEAIKLIKDIPALELIDGDAHQGIQSTDITGQGYQRLRWARYEIESYLLHPVSLERFVQKMTNTGPGDLPTHDLRKHFQDGYPPQFLTHPFEDVAFIRNTKARTELIPPLLTAAGLPAFPYQRFNEIAAIMLPEEIHPEVKQKLDLIQQAFRL
jgi:predicted ATPase